MFWYLIKYSAGLTPTALAPVLEDVQEEGVQEVGVQEEGVPPQRSLQSRIASDDRSSIHFGTPGQCRRLLPANSSKRRAECLGTKIQPTRSIRMLDNQVVPATAKKTTIRDETYSDMQTKSNSSHSHINWFLAL